MWEIGYINVLMLLATIPEYETEDEKKAEKKEIISFGEDVNALANYLNKQK